MVNNKKVAMALAGLALFSGAAALIVYVIMKNKKPEDDPDDADKPEDLPDDPDEPEDKLHTYVFYPGVDMSWFPQEQGKEYGYPGVEVAKDECDRLGDDCKTFTIFKGRVWYRPKLNDKPEDWATQGKTFNPDVEGSYVKM